MKPIKVKDIMTAGPFMILPTQKVEEAAKYMKSINCGVLPVGNPGRVTGMITDRDITLQVTAEGKDASKTTIEDVMTKKVFTCDEETAVKDAAEMMRKHNVSRLVVIKDKKVTGIVTLKQLLCNKGNRRISEMVVHELIRAQKKQAQKKMAANHKLPLPIHRQAGYNGPSPGVAAAME